MDNRRLPHKHNSYDTAVAPKASQPAGERATTIALPAEPRPQDITAIIDTREQHPLDLEPLQAIRDTLATGDYSIRGLEHVVAIERKSLADLIACCGNQRRRFQREADRLLAFPARCLVVESSWSEVERGEWKSKVSASTVIGSLLGWQASGLPVLMAGDHQRAGRYVGRLLFVVARRRWREARSLLSVVHKSKAAAHGQSPSPISQSRVAQSPM